MQDPGTWDRDGPKNGTTPVAELMLVPGTWYLVPGTWYRDGSTHQILLLFGESQKPSKTSNIALWGTWSLLTSLNFKS